MCVIPDKSERPNCQVPNCDKKAQLAGKSGKIRYRKSKWVAEKYECEGYVCQRHHNHRLAEINGYESITEFNNSLHPYLKYRKDYCENIDGRLGFECTTNIVWKGMLDVDHKDGNSDHNDPSNLQTLCKCCHAYKTNLFEDWRTPGRKQLKQQKYACM